MESFFAFSPKAKTQSNDSGSSSGLSHFLSLPIPSGISGIWNSGMEFKKLLKDLQLREQLRIHFCRIATANYYTGFSFHSQAKDSFAFETRSRTNLRKSLLSQQENSKSK